MVVTSVTIVPKSSRWDSVCWTRAEDCPVTSPPYGGRVPKSTVPDDDFGGVNTLSTPTGISLQIHQGIGPVSIQSPTLVMKLFSDNLQMAHRN